MFLIAFMTQDLFVLLWVYQLQNLETEVRPYLSRWYEESVMHIHRVVQLVQSNISFLLHAVSLFKLLLFFSKWKRHIKKAHWKYWN